MKKKSTKSALLMSFTSLLLCFAMLIGCTFAWFTDSVTSGVNKIVAGNLDIDVQYTKNGTNWDDLQGSPDLFGTALWEPGHTEYVTLKIENKGTLALNYKVMVTPVTEKGGVNVSGQSFKLSDYLKFGTTTDSSVADRAAARALVESTALSLNQANLTKTGTMAAGAAEQYITLVVYMPETVGNDANYKTGTAAPEIELGITVVATQLGDQEGAEVDSFDDDYDVGAVSEGEYNVGPAYAYWPQVAASAPVAASGDTTITATGKLNQSDEAVTLAKVTVPADAVAQGVSELTVSVKPVDATNNNALNTIQAQKDAGQEVVNFDINVEGIKSDNNTAITVEVFVGTGLNNVKAFHNGDVISGATYNSTTGKITFTTTSFSDYTVSYDQARAAIGSKTYGTLALAVAAAEDGDTVILLKNCAGNGIVVPTGKNFSVDFNGFTYDIDGTTVGSTGTETNGFQLLKDSSITFKNGKLTSDKAKILIQNYSNLMLDNMNLDGTGLDGTKYALSTNNGTTVIKDTVINAASDGFAFDVCTFGTYAGNEVTVKGNSVINGKVEISSYNTAPLKLSVESGTFNGEIVKFGECSNFIGNITGGTFSSDPSAFLASGYEVTQETAPYIVTKILPEAKIGDVEYLTLAQAIDEAADGATVVVLKDLDGGNGENFNFYVGKNLTIDFGGNTIASKTMSNGQFMNVGQSCGEIGNVGRPSKLAEYSAHAWGDESDQYPYPELIDVNNITVTLKNGTFKKATVAEGGTNGTGCFLDVRNEGNKCVIENCTYLNANVRGYNGGSVEVKSATFDNDPTGWNSVTFLSTPVESNGTWTVSAAD